jgi:small subunit ribosomal protein S9
MAHAARNYGTGRRKNAIARVWIKAGSGSITVNGRKSDDYFCRATLSALVNAPMKCVDLENRLDIVATAKGGGVSGQAGALAHGIARAIIEMDPTLRSPLRRLGHLTRDPRVKERKKYGRKRARRGFQYVKR